MCLITVLEIKKENVANYIQINNNNILFRDHSGSSQRKWHNDVIKKINGQFVSDNQWCYMYVIHIISK